jgi:hypothetical protein
MYTCALYKSSENGETLNETIPCQSSKEGVTTMESFSDIKALIQDPKEYIGALVGTLLGDSGLSKPKSHGGAGNSRLHLGQKNADYLMYKCYLFSLSMPKYPSTDGVYRVCSSRLPVYSRLYNWLYYDGRKTVTEHVLKVLTPLGLALWYMDDGDFHKDKRECKIATCGFNEAEHFVMNHMLYKRFGLRFDAHQRKSAGGPGRQSHYFYLRLKQADKWKFFDIISKYVPSFMSYKIPTAGEVLVNSISSSLANQPELRYSLNL